MQLGTTQPSDPNLTTGTKRYSLYAYASQAVFEAQQVRAAAYAKADRDPTRENIRAFMEADKAFAAAEKALSQVELLQKHNRDTVKDKRGVLHV